MTSDAMSRQPPLREPGWTAPHRASPEDLADVNLGTALALVTQRVGHVEEGLSRVEEACLTNAAAARGEAEGDVAALRTEISEVRNGLTMALVGMIGGELVLGVLVVVVGMLR